MNVNPGEQNKRIQIIKIDSSGADEEGFDTVTETVVRTCWARITQVSGTEIIRANGEFNSQERRFLIRSSKTKIDEDMIVRYSGKDYRITYINSYSEGGEYTEIWAEKEELV